MKKRRIILVLLALAILAAGVWAISRPESAIVVEGNVSAQEIREIKHAVKTAMQKKVFPSFSWSNLTAFPGRARLYLRQDVRKIMTMGPGSVWVDVETRSSTNTFLSVAYVVRKGTNGWKADGGHLFK